MRKIKVFGHPEVSLWQSVVDEIASREGPAGGAGPRPDLDHPLVKAAALMGEKVGTGAAPAAAPHLPFLSLLEHAAVDAAASLLHHMRDAVSRAWADLRGESTVLERLRD